MKIFFQEIRASWERFVERDNLEFEKSPTLYGRNFWLKIRPAIFSIATVMAVTAAMSARFQINPIFFLLTSLFLVGYLFLKARIQIRSATFQGVREAS